MLVYLQHQEFECQLPRNEPIADPTFTDRTFTDQHSPTGTFTDRAFTDRTFADRDIYRPRHLPTGTFTDRGALYLVVGALWAV